MMRATLLEYWGWSGWSGNDGSLTDVAWLTYQVAFSVYKGIVDGWKTHSLIIWMKVKNLIMEWGKYYLLNYNLTNNLEK